MHISEVVFLFHLGNTASTLNIYGARSGSGQPQTLRDGTRYTLGVTAMINGYESSRQEIQFLTNLPPTVRYCNVTPEVGV